MKYLSTKTKLSCTIKRGRGPVTEGMTMTGVPLPAATSLQPPPILKFRPGRPPPPHLDALLPFHALLDFPISGTDILFYLRTLKHIRNMSPYSLSRYPFDVTQLLIQPNSNTLLAMFGKEVLVKKELQILSPLTLKVRNISFRVSQAVLSLYLSLLSFCLLSTLITCLKGCNMAVFF